MIQFNTISLKYGNRCILNNLSGNFQKEKLTYIIGSNGSGKTSFLKILAGLMQGDVRWDGKKVSELSLLEQAHHRSFLEGERTCTWNMTGQQIIELSSYAKKASLSWQKKVTTWLETAPLEQRFFNTLSSGEKSRILIARALMQQTPLLFADEPFSHLDWDFQDHVVNIFKMLTQKEGMTIILTLHERHLFHYADHIFMLKDGALLGCVKDALSNSNREESHQLFKRSLPDFCD